MHLLPRRFVFAGRPLLLPGRSAGTAALLLPSCCSVLQESPPHLLPRRAFFGGSHRGKAS
ncbi:MAG: hypothetical protein DI537_32720 [Stutzerimonas stutzeri]|nr:MAG: hypothetical protein DI537_32720 [Stutzerimonas stutzeri]